MEPSRFLLVCVSLCILKLLLIWQVCASSQRSHCVVVRAQQLSRVCATPRMCTGPSFPGCTSAGASVTASSFRKSVNLSRTLHTSLCVPQLHASYLPMCTSPGSHILCTPSPNHTPFLSEFAKGTPSPTPRMQRWRVSSTLPALVLTRGCCRRAGTTCWSTSTLSATRTERWWRGSRGPTTT